VVKSIENGVSSGLGENAFSKLDSPGPDWRRFQKGSFPMEANANIFTLPTPAEITDKKLAQRWGGHESLFAKPEGWVGVPAAFLRLYGSLKPYQLTVAEAMFVIEIMAYKWGAKAPFPSYGTIAKRMGVSTKMVQRYARQLEEKGYLRRQARIGTSNAFDLQPLFDALALAITIEKKMEVA
jgi:hypothetical protein